jgi:hypothetical protein
VASEQPINRIATHAHRGGRRVDLHLSDQRFRDLKLADSQGRSDVRSTDGLKGAVQRSRMHRQRRRYLAGCRPDGSSSVDEVERALNEAHAVSSGWFGVPGRVCLDSWVRIHVSR